MNTRPTHRVSVKIALFNTPGDRVLMTVLPGGQCGLPGGHIEGLERPDETLRRELEEELGLGEGTYRNVVQSKFWREKNGERIILGYTGVLDEEATIVVAPEEVVGIRWVSYEDLADGTVATAYTEYLFEVW